jgi:O-antigen ligase
VPFAKRHEAVPGVPRLRSNWLSAAGYLMLAGLVLLVGRLLAKSAGADLFAGALAAILLAAVYLMVSFRHLTIPFYLFILSVGGFRFIWSIQMPGLPDLYLDRMFMIWLAIVFLIKFVSERRPLRGPFALDVLLLVHGIYLFVQIMLHDMHSFHEWTMSILVPYGAYFFAKNIVTTRQQIRLTLWMLFALSVYYNVTAVAEKYDFNALIWPRGIREGYAGYVNRSVGPFMHAPLFGTVIGMLLPLHLYFLATIRSRLGGVLLVVSLLVGLAGIAFTYTRGGWIACGAALVVTAVLNRKTYLRYLMPAAVLAPVMAIAVLGLAQDKFMQERLENEDTVGSRFGTGVTVLRVWRDHPLFGVGFFQFQNVREQYIQPVEIPGMATIRYVQFRHNAIHDIYLGPLAETGLVGMGLQCAIYFLIGKRLLRWRARQREGDHFSNFVVPVFGGVFVGYLAGGLAIDYRFFSAVGTYFLVCAGILDGHVERDRLAPSPDAGGSNVASCDRRWLSGPNSHLEV